MINNHLTKFSVACILLAVSTLSNADSITYSGSLNSIYPEVEVNVPSTPIYIGVEEYPFEPKSVNNVCSLTSRPSLARRGLDGSGWICEFEWVSGPVATQAEELDQSLRMGSVGTQTFNYSVNIYSSSSEQKIQLRTGSVTVEALQPEPPTLVSATGRWSNSEKSEGTTYYNFDTEAKLMNVSVVVEPRPYKQKVELANGESCTIRANDNTCSVYTGGLSYGDTVSNITGNSTLTFTVDAVNDFFSSTDNILNIEWDYRQPSIAAVDYHLQGTGSATKTVVAGGQEFTIDEEEAIVIIESPHTARADQWWYPQEQRLIFERQEGLDYSNSKMIEGKRITFDIPNYNSSSRIRVSHESREISGSFIVYKYSLNSVPDATFDVTFDGNDKFQNGDVSLQANQLLDRLPPAIEVIMGGRTINNDQDIVFTEDLMVAASSGFDDGVSITNITFNGQVLGTNVISADVHDILENAESGLVAGETYTLHIEAVDGGGNTGSRDVPLRWNYSSFEIQGVSDTVYRGVQEISAQVIQTQGRRCANVSSQALAEVSSTTYTKGCVVEWVNIPSGLEEGIVAGQVNLVGVIDTVGSANIEFNLWYYNSNGNRVLGGNGTKSINTVEPNAPSLILSPVALIGPGVTGIRQSNEVIARYQVASHPADLEVVMVNTNTNEETITEHSQLGRRTDYTAFGSVQEDNISGLALFDRYSVDITARYKRRPDLFETISYDVIKVPEENVMVNASPALDAVTSEDDIEIDIEVGIPQNGSYTFDSAAMGDYNVHLARRDGASYVPFTTPISIDSDGKANFTFPASEIFGQGELFYAIAELDSPQPEFTRTLVSLPQFMVVLKGTAVEADIVSRKITGRVPFYANVAMEYDSDQDRRVAQNIRWQTSEDNVVWTDAAELDDRQIVNFVLATPKTIFVRGSVENKATGEVTLTQSLEMSSYEVPILSIEGTRQVYVNDQVELTLHDAGTALLDSQGIAEWSTDNGETWQAGTIAQTFQLGQGSHMIRSRFKYHSDSSNQEDAQWGLAIMYIDAVEPKQVILNSNRPYLSEVGTTINVSGVVNNPYPQIENAIVQEWELPDGSVIQANDFQYLVEAAHITSDDNIEFIQRAWVEGYRTETYAENTVKTRGWNYVFPTLELALNSSVLVAPSNIYAVLSQSYQFAPGVEYTYEWIFDEAQLRGEMIAGKTALIVAEQMGVHQISVRVADNRGNEEVLTQFIDIVEPEAMEVNLRMYTSNPYNRVPLLVTAFVGAKPGHPYDFAESHEWLVDGVPIDGNTSSIARLEFTDPGDHTVTVRVTSKFGQVEEFTEVLSTVPNEAPICDPIITEGTTYFEVNTNCTDTDGRVVEYEWTWDDNFMGPLGTVIRFPKTDYPSLSGSFTATDEVGGETTRNFSF